MKARKKQVWPFEIKKMNSKIFFHIVYSVIGDLHLLVCSRLHPRHQRGEDPGMPYSHRTNVTKGGTWKGRQHYIFP
jgi:hypothetical protein